MGESIVPDFLLMQQDGLYAISSTSCRAWINALGQVERSIQKFKEKASWLSKVDPDTLWDLLSWLVLGHWEPWLRSI